MRVGYIDAQFGASGNMLLGALLECGVPKNFLTKELIRISLPAYKINFSRKLVSAIDCMHVDVEIIDSKVLKQHRTFSEIRKTINSSRLKPAIKKKALAIFKVLISAEAKVHGKPLTKVHLHDVGAVDAIVDIVGTLICLDYLKIERVFVSDLPLAQGKLNYHHGKLMLPAPATAEIISHPPHRHEGESTLQPSPIHGELVTPTGAAILQVLAQPFTDLPRLEIETIGYGAGTKEFENHPNYLRVFMVLQIETNIDDMNPKKYDGTIKKLMKAGALDVAVVPIRMKKGRTGHQLQVLCEPERKARIMEQIFRLTSTIGIRIFLVPRSKLIREINMIGGKKVKISFSKDRDQRKVFKNFKFE
jgi:uncharacterized protein (TIGR00299 family) protein